MALLADHQSTGYTKLLVMGDSKSGKTGSLTSLVKEGYWLGILDFDNLLDVLRYYVLHECPDKIGNVEFRSLRDKRKSSPIGPVIDGVPKAFMAAAKMLDRWAYTDVDGTEVDYGPPAEWGPNRILVIDSLSRMCDAAYDFREPLTPKGKGTGEIDTRAVYGDAQDACENVLAWITSETFRTNVIVMAHVLYQETGEGKIKGFPQGVGQKLSPKIPQYFPSVVFYTNQGGKRTIVTTSTPLVDLANPNPLEIQARLPLETGLADFFRALRPAPLGATPTQALTPPKPKLTLRRVP